MGWEGWRWDGGGSLHDGEVLNRLLCGKVNGDVALPLGIKVELKTKLLLLLAITHQMQRGLLQINKALHGGGGLQVGNGVCLHSQREQFERYPQKKTKRSKGKQGKQGKQWHHPPLKAPKGAGGGRRHVRHQR